MTRITPYIALALLGLTGCNTDSVRRASAQQIPATQTSASDMRPASGPQQAYELRRVWSGSRFDFHWNEPSPDGRYISEIQWWSGNLAVTDLVTGEMVAVTRQTEWEGNAWGSVFSPDGIPAQGTALFGAQYEFLDVLVRKSGVVHYYLEDIDTQEAVTRHGPIVIDFGATGKPGRKKQ